MSKKILLAIVGVLVLAVALVGGVWFSMKPDAVAVDRIQKGVAFVLIFEPTKDGPNIGQGSAFVVDDRGHMVTNAHVAGVRNKDGSFRKPKQGERWLYICYTKENAKGNTVVVCQEAKVLHLESSKDLALLYVDNIDRSCLQPLALGPSPQQNDEVMPYGFPGNFDVKNNFEHSLLHSFLVQHAIKGATLPMNRVVIDSPDVDFVSYLKAINSRGAVNRVDASASLRTRAGQDATLRIITTEARIHAGMSGGPMINENGQVVGVNYGSGTRIEDERGREISDLTHQNLAVSVDELKDYLDRMHAMDRSKPPYYIEGDPDSFMRTMRSYISKARPYELALAGFGLVLFFGAVVTLIALVVRQKSSDDDEDEEQDEETEQEKYDNPEQDPTSAPQPDDVEPNDGKTMPLNTGAKLVLTGVDAYGKPLRYTLTEQDLLSKGNILMGRGGDCDICLPYNEYISRKQAVLIYKQQYGYGCLFIADAKATNPTMLNNKPVWGELPVNEGDVISVGPVSLKVSVEN